MRTLQEFCVFCCHKCHTNTITHYVITVYIDFRNNIPHCHTFTLLLHPQNPPNTILKTTFRPPIQNNTLFSIKRHDVFYKTIRCFQQNHTSLSIKRCVVFGMMKYFQFHPLWHLWQQKNKTPSTRARIHARVRTPSANTQPSPHPIKPTHPLLHSSESPFIKTFTYEEIFISNETTIDKSAMKQPTTNHSSNPKPILICTTYTSVSQSKDNKTRGKQRKNGTNMPFFHSLRLFPPIY